MLRRFLSIANYPPSPVDMYVTKLEKSDIPKVIGLTQTLGLCVWTAASLAYELTRADSIMLKLCDDDSSLIGFAAGRTVDPEEHVVELFNIGVERDKQGSGSGQMLLENFLKACKSIGTRRILLEVRVSNSRAISFYKRNGFIKLGLRPGFYSDPPEDGFTMELKPK
jgi:ribosomal-protein-alanine N-acetyltransferase